ncbi:MAG: hypothetical protein JWN29_1678 [Acidimicrobiales bacterium]|nr:hypothetical protein [Acidimicrobiales bacterium]
MFIQVIEGRTKDPEALHRQLDVWESDLKPGAIGYLGSTGGCTSTGDCILVARFESREAAQRNADRPEQTRWWQETEKTFDGSPRFHDSTDVQVTSHGDLDRAGFVQVMEGHVTDHDRAVAVEQESDSMLTEMRPDLIGYLTAYFDDNEFTEVAYFTTESAARGGESQQLPDEAAKALSEWQDVMKVERYLDLPQPWLTKA